MSARAGAGDGDFAALSRKIAAESGFACGAYRPLCLQRRIAVRMRAIGAPTYDDYARRLDGDAAEYDRLLAALTVNVTRLFRDADVFALLARQVVPELWARPERRLRLWSAGCASGEEAYSLAALLVEHAGADAAARRVEILATDIDVASLHAASAGRYAERAFADVPAALRARWFGAGPGGVADPALRALVRVERRDLFDPPPDGPFQLILCRNVLIYLDRDAQDAVVRAFHRTLAPAGVLVLGKVESPVGAARDLFAPLAPRERVYRRAGRGAA